MPAGQVFDGKILNNFNILRWVCGVCRYFMGSSLTNLDLNSRFEKKMSRFRSQ